MKGDLEKIQRFSLRHDEVVEDERRFLRAKGWKYSCDFPDCCWRWCKEINGVMVAVSQSDALSFEESWAVRDFRNEAEEVES